MSSSRSHHVLTVVSFYYNKFVATNLFDNGFILFLFSKVSTLCCCSITNTVISLVANKPYQIRVNNQEKIK